ncbi:methyltransferase domain-containing protein [Marinobacter xestospongiae]|uniref:Methyltransferase n=1 Tax=Marinobacter xestospongiae TaxID=994319 RepID=A0ABU3VVJ5_9GAMM|nr:methyltransferase domain-containing protein [Marinobacter xestospongiae]MDV2078299.1 methyltransferase [Marinobacter xestospongiae]
MPTSHNHPLQPFWQLAGAAVQGATLDLALAHQLPHRLQRPHTADDLAAALGWQSQPTRVVLDQLWGLGLLQRWPGPDGHRYQSSALAARYFSPDSADDCSQAWQFRHQALALSRQDLEARLRGEAQAPATASPAQGPADAQAAWARAAQQQIAAEQRAVTVPAVLEHLTTLPPLAPATRLLDLGGGPGLVAIALAQHYPSLTGVVFDLPASAAVAAGNIRQAELTGRLAAVGGRADEDDLQGPYDLIWCSSVLHFLPDPLAMLARLAEALAPGGRLICAHAERPASAEAAAAVLPFYSPMLLRGRYLPEPGAIEAALRQLGLADRRTALSHRFPMAPLWLHSGTRPA